MSARTKAEIIKLIRYSESLNSKVSEDSREALRSLIDQGEAIGHLVQYYSLTQSFRALDLLCRIKEPHDTELCNRMQDCVGKNPIAAIILLGQIVQKAPSWLTKLTEHSLFTHLLKVLHTSDDTVIMVAGILFISSLLPHCSTIKRPLLNDLFRTLLTACVMLQRKKRTLEKEPNNYLESVHVSHLYCAIIQYFVVFYGIYPNSLVEFLRDRYAKQNDYRIFSVLEPIYGVVKFHPLLVRMTAEQELSRSRWSQREAHDFLADCRHILIRPAMKTGNVCAQTSPSRSESSAAPLQFYGFSPQTASSRSSSNYRSSDSRWGESWSPSVNLGLETPPGTRSATPIVQNANVFAAHAIVPSTAGSQRSAEGSDEMRKSKRGSISQKLVDLVRGRKNGSSSTSKEQEVKKPSFLERLESTQEETEDIEVIDALADDKSRVSLGSHVEEGVEAATMHGSPTSTVSRNAKLDPTAFLSSAAVDGKGTVSLTENSEKTPSAVLRSRSASLAQGSLPPVQIEKAPFVAAGESPDPATLGLSDDDANEEDGGAFNENGTDSHSNRFSVTSFFRTVNRQRFISECPPKSSQLTCTSDENRRKRSDIFSASGKWKSCPDLAEEDELEGSSQNIPIVTEAKKSTGQASLSSATLAGMIEKEFPYLTFLQALPYHSIDEEAMDADLKREHEMSRELYMQASLEHHRVLKKMNLADRLPAKIYDDMSNLIQGLSSEKQLEILRSRLSLVNQHLMYERSGRLLHAERNRRLFGRLKQQKLSEVEKISLQKELHAAQMEREELVNALSGLRKAEKQMEKDRADSELRYGEKMKSMDAEVYAYKNELDDLKRKTVKLTEENERHRKELNLFCRRCEDAEVSLKLTEAKVAVLEGMRTELARANEANQLLKDKVALCEIQNKKQSTGISAVLPTTSDRDERLLMAQIEKLKKDLRNEQNAIEILRAKKTEIDEAWRIEREKCIDFKSLLERAAMVHKQQSDAAQHKYLSLLSVCQKQQAHILELCAQIEQIANKRVSPTSPNSSASLFTEAVPVQIPRGMVPDEILSYDSTAGSENTMFFADISSPVEGIRAAGGLFEFSPGHLGFASEIEQQRFQSHPSYSGRTL